MLQHFTFCFRSKYTMAESRRRAEIESKRAKLAELKRAREERDRRIAAGRGEKGSEVRSIGRFTVFQRAQTFATLQASTPAARKDLDDLVASLVGTSAGTSGITSGARSGASSAIGRIPSYTTTAGDAPSDGGTGLLVEGGSPARGARVSTGAGASSEYGSEAMGREDGVEG